jgi:hypothetical protein
LITQAAERAREVVGTAQKDFPTLDWIARHAAEPGSVSAVTANMRRLSEGHAAVLATVRPDILGGTLSVLIKCVAVARISAALQSAGVSTVPVIWVKGACPDAGVRPLYFLNTQSHLVPVSTTEVCAQPGKSSLSELFAKIEQVGTGQLGGAALDFFRNHYQGAIPGTAFCRLFSALLERWGCVLLRADDGEPGRSPESYLPVAVQVCDPLETGAPQPFRWERPRVVLLDPRSRKFLDKNKLSYEDLLRGRQECLRRISNQDARNEAVLRLDAAQEAVQRRTAELESLAAGEDSLREFVQSSRSKMLYQTGKLKERYVASVNIREEADRRQLDRIFDFLLPAGQEQEAVLATAFFLMRSSTELPALIYKGLDVTVLDRQIIPMD